MHIAKTNSGACFKLNVGSMEISLACEPAGDSPIYSECDLRIFDLITGDETTEAILGVKRVHPNSKDLINIIEEVKKFELGQMCHFSTDITETLSCSKIGKFDPNGFPEKSCNLFPCDKYNDICRSVMVSDRERAKHAEIEVVKEMEEE